MKPSSVKYAEYINSLNMRFEILTAVKMVIVFWVVTPCRLVGRYHVLEKHTSPFTGLNIVLVTTC
jgi:hypothetical protein